MSASDYLDSQRASHPESSHYYHTFADLHKKKLWHQLTIQLEEFVNLPQAQGEELIQLYQRFIKDFEIKINLLTLVKICIVISAQYRDPKAALEFLQGISNKVKGDVQAHILAQSVVALMQLKADLLDQCKETLELTKSEVEGISGVDAAVYSAYYKVWADYHKRQNSPMEFYRSALMYLMYVSLDTLPENEKLSLAFDLGISALIGENIYNFGELLANDILKSLEGSSAEWLVELLRVFNSGDIAGYENVVVKFRDQLSAQPALKQNQLLLQKISILALMELAFKRPSDLRTISFADISTATKLPVFEVEHLVMKALSLKLVKGTIDEVDQTVNITWVQPRVLDINQISAMKDRLQQWTQKVQTTLTFMENEITPEISA